MPRELDTLLGRVRELTAGYKSGRHEALAAWRNLSTLLLETTVLRRGSAPRLYLGPGGRTEGVLGGMRNESDPLPLRDGRFLRLTMRLRLVRETNLTRLKVDASAFQYQLDEEGRRWVFRYDYLRVPPAPYPGAHLQVRGKLRERAAPGGGSRTERLHFPTGRVALEAVIRLLVEQFRVPTAQPAAVWRPVLAVSEREFQRIAHQPPSGPEA